MRNLCALLALALAACGGGTEMSIADDEQPLGRCTDLDGRAFTSVDVQPDCGLGPDGPVPCNWSITFSDDGAQYTGWTWHHSDVGQSGDIRCAGGTQIVTITDGTGETHSASYDAGTDRLTWDGIAYKGN